MVAIWPADLPQRVLVDGFQASYPGGRLLTPMENGLLKSRRRFSKAARPVSAQIAVTDAQRARFMRFWTHDTGGGVLPFAIRDQQADGLPLMGSDGAPLKTAGGDPILVEAWWLCLFGQDEPSETPFGVDMWRISFSLVILPS